MARRGQFFGPEARSWLARIGLTLGPMERRHLRRGLVRGVRGVCEERARVRSAPKDFQKLKLGKIYKEGWFVIYTARDRPSADRRKLYFHVDDKHLFVTSCLEFILELVAKYKGNNKDDVKCFTDVITWYIHVRKLLLTFIPKVYKV
ncbi:unnamed protein product [Lactuca saligna]|uniref:Uncharacterized protein n=1 Tax=Lactuca saligna TaxID=75948 RepID=A0AA35YAW2_LACSI|nr:unnamed protein product [Lactuca saligna]